MNERIENQQPMNRRDSVAGGIVLIGLGALFLFGQFFNIGEIMLPLLALAFLVTGVAARRAGWFIPSGILGGLALGVASMERIGTAGSDAEAGIFLLSFALGWASISGMYWLFTRQSVRWPLIPSVVLGLIGFALFAGEKDQRLLEIAFNVFAYAWPFALILVGGAMLLRIRQQRRD